MIDLSYDFDADLWLWPAKDAWHFITLPVEHAEEIRFFAKTRNGFGSLRVTVRIGASAWKTSIFPDSRTGKFCLAQQKRDTQSRRSCRGRSGAGAFGIGHRAVLIMA